MSTPLVPSDLLRIVLVGDPQISPDGTAIYYRRAWFDRDALPTLMRLFAVRRAIEAGNCKRHDGRCGETSGQQTTTREGA